MPTALKRAVGTQPGNLLRRVAQLQQYLFVVFTHLGRLFRTHPAEAIDIDWVADNPGHAYILHGRPRHFISQHLRVTGEILKLRERLNDILAHHTGQALDRIAQDTERDYYMSGQEACDYGLVDQVVTQRLLVPSPSRSNGGGNGGEPPDGGKGS